MTTDPALEACLKALQPGNTFVIWKLDRLGRNLKHLVTTVEELHGRGVGLRVFAGTGAEIDTTTGRLVFGIFAALAETDTDFRFAPSGPALLRALYQALPPSARSLWRMRTRCGVTTIRAPLLIASACWSINSCIAVTFSVTVIPTKRTMHG